MNDTLRHGYESAVELHAETGQRLTALLRRLNGYSATLEVPGYWPWIRLSERITQVKIWAAGAQLYDGPAVLTNLVEADTGCVAEIKLDSAAISRSLVQSDATLSHAATFDFEAFLRYWQGACRLSPEYKVAVADLYNFLTELRLWLKRGQFFYCEPANGDVRARSREWAEHLMPKFTRAFGELFQRYEEATSKIDPELVPVHYRFGRQQLHPILLCSPFVRRSFEKPLGYSGDYEVVNMMFRDPFEAETLVGMLINGYALQLPPIVGHRNRIAYLKQLLVEESLRLAPVRARLRVFSLGCGPAHEIQQFLAESELSERLDAVLADFNDETVHYTRRAIETVRLRHRRDALIRVIRQSAQEFLREVEKQTSAGSLPQYDFAYCAGLFDYLSDRLCRCLLEALYTTVAPGGLLVATNVDEHPARYEMECFLDWHLIYRNTARMATLAPRQCSPDMVTVRREASGVNVFLEIRKPA